MADSPPPATVVRPRPHLPLFVLAVHTALWLAVPLVVGRLLVPASDRLVAWLLVGLPVVLVGVAVVLAVRGGAPWWSIVVPAHADPRRWIYVGFDVAFTLGYLYAFRTLMPNRHDWAMWILYLLPLSTWLLAVATALARPWSWWLVLVGAATMLVWLVATMVVLLYTASYLAGVYGAFGKAASSGVLGAMALLVQFVALLPAFQLKWAMTRAGRRTFGLRPLWPAPAREAA